jgi:hypothetical protein
VTLSRPGPRFIFFYFFPQGSRELNKRERNDFIYAFVMFPLPASKADERWVRILKCIMRTIKLFFKAELLESNQQAGRWSSTQQLVETRPECRNLGLCPGCATKDLIYVSQCKFQLPICKTEGKCEM